ncbi:hypothetical protein AVEN_176180-1 [Araneus ventricosus]|uniref:DUF4817 domain-containing protein n=1 Tax=Araneus ventricosus TaxID=182803 RepID=A0A4Y1ZVV5_ARAVE|nr:hypothetical protein AVEN_254955-1 [Araneus ventricosus]GBL70873.1 hypothetical protein AVEN_115463-1 [Araneus ventricosus]GBL70890.1 hypothetical protein AVEN_139421-1 [Araneus ventricosus]GBL70912.1 hypothetical protein AVEN_176180-1 [Araneus ventricosus]
MWTPQEKVQCAASFIEIKSDTQVQRNFRTQYGREPPSRPTIRVWYTTFRETSSVLYKQGAGHPSVSDANVAFGYLYEPGYTLWCSHFSSNLRHLGNKNNTKKTLSYLVTC